MNIPVLIKNKRSELKETQAEFGRRFGVSNAAVSDWESGKSEAGYKTINFCLQGVEVNRVSCSVCKGRGYIEETVTYNYERR